MSETIAVGTVLAGKYRVERVLGSGGMGMVVAAHHLQLDEKVAIKLQQPSLAQSPEALARFAREARAAVKIKSEYVARVSDVGVLTSGAPYMVMEYLEGKDLAAMLEAGPLPPEQAVEFVLQACEALAEAHALGIIHRDIKPANLFCVRRTDGLLAIKLLDFGISRANRSTDLALTSSGVLMGSPHYMAPEQMIAAKNADERSDIWSLGAVLFELLVGAPPFNAETFAALVLEVTTADPAKLARRLQRLPTGLAQIVLRCLQVEAALRYRSVSELAPALVPFGPAGRGQIHADRVSRIARTSQHPRSLETVGFEGTEWSDRGGKTLSPLGRTSSEGWAPTSRRARVTAVALGLCALGAGGWFAANRHASARGSADRNAMIPVPASSGGEESAHGRDETTGAAPTVSSTMGSPPTARAGQNEQAAMPVPAPPPRAPVNDPQQDLANRPVQIRTARVHKSRTPVASPAPPAPAPESATRAPEPAKTDDPQRPNFGGRL